MARCAAPTARGTEGAGRTLAAAERRRARRRADTSSRTTTAQGRGGQTRDRYPQREQGRRHRHRRPQRPVQYAAPARAAQKEYEMDDGRVESVERDTTVTNRQGQTANWEGKAEREGYGWEFEGEGKNRYGQSVEANGYAARGPYGKRRRGRRGRRAVRRPDGRRGSSLRRTGVRGHPAGRISWVQLPWPALLRLRRRLLPALRLVLLPGAAPVGLLLLPRTPIWSAPSR